MSPLAPIASRLFQTCSGCSGGGSVRTVPTSATASRGIAAAMARRAAASRSRNGGAPASGQITSFGATAAGEPVSASMRRKLAASAAGSLRSVCGIEGWTRRRFMPATTAPSSWPSRAAPPSRERAEQHHGEVGRVFALAREVAEPRRQRCRQHGEEAQPVDADRGRRLEHEQAAGKIAGPGIADEIPREAREDVAAQIFRHRPPRDEDEDARRAADIEAVARDMARQQRERGEDREPGRHAEHGERQEPAELRDIDEQRRGDPVKSGDEEAEAEAPAEREGRARVGAAVLEPDEARERDEKRGREIERRQRRRGKRAQEDRREMPRPSFEPGGDEGDPLHRVERAGGAEIGRRRGLTQPGHARPRPEGRARAGASPGADRRRARRTRGPRDA